MKNRIVLLLAISLLLNCSSLDKNSDQTNLLGILNHKFDISEPAKNNFETGLLFLHSFEYEDARKEFEKAIASDSTEMMAHWGNAMSYYKALWGLQDVEGGRAAMRKLGASKEERLAKIKDQLESDFWNGLELLYGDGEFYERNKAHADHMANLYKNYPDNHEVAAFYALGLMWTTPNGREKEIFNLSANIASGILEENPNHPGALHYLIHANDDPGFAQYSKLAADQYSKVAPDAVHALHMPSHIYLALGMWNEVVTSNEASYGASVKKMNERGLDDKARGYHSYAWLHYGYLQQGRFDKAGELMRDMQEYTVKAQTQIARVYLIAMQSAQLIETGNWIEGAEPISINCDDLGLVTKAENHFFKAAMAYQKGKRETILNETATLEKLISAAALLLTDQGIAMCSAGTTRYAPSRDDINKANVMIYQMKAFVAMLDNDDKMVEQNLIEATRLEAKAIYPFGPPTISYPSFEQYGEWLLTRSKAQEALTQFDRSLAVAPNRSKALKGKIKALKMLNRDPEVIEIETLLNSFGGQAESI